MDNTRLTIACEENREGGYERELYVSKPKLNLG